LGIWYPCPGPTRASYRLELSWGGELKDPYRYVIHAYEDVRQRRPIKHEHGGTTILTDGTEALERAEVLARTFPDGWVYIHVEYRGEKE
jgi:hypothetical protein